MPRFEFKMPPMYGVRQRFDEMHIGDVEHAVDRAMAGSGVVIPSGNDVPSLNRSGSRSGANWLFEGC
jgi:hypothetical protein